MLTALGILLLVAGAILTFAVDRQADGVDLPAVGWILMAGGGLSMLAEMIRIAGLPRVRPAGSHDEQHADDAGRPDRDDRRPE